MTTRFATLFVFSALSTFVQAQENYPIVDKLLQKTRDDARRLILETELQAERAALASAQAGSNPVAVHRHIENIKALGRELAGAGGKQASSANVRHDESGPLVVGAAREPHDRGSAATAPQSYRPAPFWDPYSRSSDASDYSGARQGDPP